jgi:transcriptional regulator with XRE-family HTH domain
MSLAQRVRDYRYSKGWGPDELANRAAISRTALYQIESGKTELPRAGTLRRIAVALEVPMEDLLGTGIEPGLYTATLDRNPTSRTAHARFGWPPVEEGPVWARRSSSSPGVSPSMGDDPRYNQPSPVRGRPISPETPVVREGELISKFHELLRSSFGESISSVIEELHQVLVQSRGSS